MLKSIIKDGFWPRYCLEDVRWHGRSSYDFIAFPMVCFCDIPIGRIDEHVAFYGSFGLGLTRSWAERSGLNPVAYFVGENALLGALNGTAEKLYELTEAAKQVEALRDYRYILSYSKPVRGEMHLVAGPVEKDFYQESEWRYVPRHSGILEYLTRGQFDDKELLERQNNKTREVCALKVAPADIRYIFVPRDSDIPGIVNFIQTDLDMYPGGDLKVLVSRVISLESLTADM